MIHRQKNFTALLVGLKWERVCSPGDTWRCLRTSVIVPTACVCVCVGGVLGAFGRGLGCCYTSDNAQDFPHNEESLGSECQQC